MAWKQKEIMEFPAKQKFIMLFRSSTYRVPQAFERPTGAWLEYHTKQTNRKPYGLKSVLSKYLSNFEVFISCILPMNYLQTTNKCQISQANCSLQSVCLFTVTEMWVTKKPTVLLTKAFNHSHSKSCMCEEHDSRVLGKLHFENLAQRFLHKIIYCFLFKDFQTQWASLLPF